MTKAGIETIETAKQNGSWVILDEVERLIIPEDLAVTDFTDSKRPDLYQDLLRLPKKDSTGFSSFGTVNFLPYIHHSG